MGAWGASLFRRPRRSWWTAISSGGWTPRRSGRCWRFPASTSAASRLDHRPHPTPHAGAPPQFLACICCRGRAWFACQGRPRPPFPPRRCVKHPGLCVLYVSHVCGRIFASAGNLVSVSHIFGITPRRPIGSAHLSEVHVRSPAARRPVGVSVAKTTHTHTATDGRLRRLTFAAWRRTAPLLVSLRPVLPAASLCCALVALRPAFAPG